jgi:hypothetical protein
MSAPYRIRRPALKKVAATKGDQFKEYLERLMKLIPAEVIGLYLTVIGVIPNRIGMALWAGFCLIAVLIIRIWGTADAAAHEPPDWKHVFISVVAYLVWIYSSGSGPFAAFNLYVPWVGTVLVFGVTFLAPYIYRGS